MPKKPNKGKVMRPNRWGGGRRGDREMASKKAAAKAAAERRREALRQFMEANGLTPASWATAAKLATPNALYNFLKGRSDSLSLQTLDKLAAAVPGTKLTELTGESLVPAQRGIVRLRVIGEVQAGRWGEAAEKPAGEQVVIMLTASKIAQPEKTFGLVVRGTSMNQMYAPGTLLECIKYADFDRPLRSKDRVIVLRRNREGLVEATCKQLQIDEGRAWLWPRSNDPEHQQPISVTWPPDPDTGTTEDGAEKITIDAVVVRSIRDEIDL